MKLLHAYRKLELVFIDLYSLFVYRKLEHVFIVIVYSVLGITYISRFRENIC